ncbi:MAG: hypothetical protein K6G07_01020, partial [Lachnospiraceae bacterium]|nr:hypothetical protein [Lachnospiraceae bacterium]
MEKETGFVSKEQFQANFFKYISGQMQSDMSLWLLEADHAMHERDQERGKKDLEQVMADAKRTLQFSDKMAEYYSLTGGSNSPKEAVYRLDSLVEEMQAFAMQYLADTGMHFHMTYEPDMPKKFFGDMDRILYVFETIVDYHINYTDSKTIMVTLRAEKKSYGTVLKLELDDDGKIIEKQALRNLRMIVKTGNFMQMGYGSEQESAFMTSGVFLNQLTGKISYNKNEMGGNNVRIEIPQLAVDE